MYLFIFYVTKDIFILTYLPTYSFVGIMIFNMLSYPMNGSIST